MTYSSVATTEKPTRVASFLKFYNKNFIVLKDDIEERVKDRFFLNLFKLFCKAAAELHERERGNLGDCITIFNKIEPAYEKYQDTGLINFSVNLQYFSAKQQALISFKAAYARVARLTELRQRIEEVEEALKKIGEKVAELNEKITAISAAQEELKAMANLIKKTSSKLVLTAGITVGFLLISTVVNGILLVATLGTSAGANGAATVLLTTSITGINTLMFIASLRSFFTEYKKLQNTFAQYYSQKTKVDEQLQNYMEELSKVEQARVSLADFKKLLMNTQTTVARMSSQTNSQLLEYKQAEAEETAKVRNLSNKLCTLKQEEKEYVEYLKKSSAASTSLTAFKQTFFAVSKEKQEEQMTYIANDVQVHSL